MVELVELLGQLVAIVGDATWAVVLASLFDGGGELVEFLDEGRLLGVRLGIDQR